MLTLFEYLRQRAFEAVIDGTHDAMEYLESQKNFDNSDASGRSRLRSQRTTIARQGESQGATENKNSAGLESPSNNDLQKEPALPAPRRRGRPRKNGSGEK